MIIFCFLTYNDIIPIKYWNTFFNNIDINKYKVWIHPKYSTTNDIYNFPINIVKNKIKTVHKSDISIVQSTLQMFKEAYDENTDGNVFIFCSQNCIPLYTFDFYEKFTNNLNKSIVSFIDFNLKDRYLKLGDKMKEYITYQQFVKQQPNMILIRDDIKLLIDNDFTQNFKNLQCPDEHYFINILLYVLKKDIIKSQTHFCNFDSSKTQSLSFTNINEKLINNIKEKGYLFMRKVI